MHPTPFYHKSRSIAQVEGTEATTSSSSSISHRLNDLQDLQENTDKLLQLRIFQQALAQECSNKQIDELLGGDKCVDGILEGSLRFLDICSTAKECRQISKESLHELHSVIKRRKANETVFTTEGGKYLASRNKLKKAIRKALRNLKTIKSEGNQSRADDQQSRSSCSLKELACDSQESQTNEFDKVDAALHSFLSHKPSPIEYLLNQIENLEMCIQDLEIGVEHLTRKLIRNIVSLLNIFNH
ncbi:hypothetical protein JHK82_014055 [Glycine max]|nr:hypothetical protein JHK85_014428 [Glycine max]KAG5147174.1 hypothetical protein JHK82_014055 [Glycine max]